MSASNSNPELTTTGDKISSASRGANNVISRPSSGGDRVSSRSGQSVRSDVTITVEGTDGSVIEYPLGGSPPGEIADNPVIPGLTPGLSPAPNKQERGTSETAEDEEVEIEVKDGDNEDEENASTMSRLAAADGVIQEEEETDEAARLSKAATPNAQDDDAYYDTDLEMEAVDSGYQYHNISSAKIYRETCKMYNVVPASYFSRHLASNTECIRMRHHGLGPQGARAIAVPLVSNMTVTELDLEDNWIEGLGAEYLTEMLKENFNIVSLSLANNQLGTRGALAMSDLLQWNSCITTLDLSCNNFTDHDAYPIAVGIHSNGSIRELNLSRNHFSKCGSILAHALAENYTLEVFDISWNEFRAKSAMQLVDGITQSPRLTEVNLSWNGLGNEGAFSLGKLLKNNQVLTSLDISSTRLSFESMMAICKGMIANEGLKILKMNGNNIKTEGATKLLKSMHNERNGIGELYIENIILKEDCYEMYKTMTANGRKLLVKHGGMFNNPNIRVFPIDSGPNPVKIVQLYLHSRQVSLRDLFPELDPEQPVGMDAFVNALTKSEMDLTQLQIKSLVRRMGVEGKKKFKYASLENVIKY